MVTARHFQSVIITDCGSTTTKAILIERQPDGGYRLTARGEAPTTVEAPVEDVTRGVLNAVRELAELRGRSLLETSDSGELRIARPQRGELGVDLYLSSSSAGGGLQMVVAGVVRKMTTESATRAALGAGAIVMDALAVNDARPPHEVIERLRALRPDMILLAGGTDGGTTKHVMAQAELIAAAEPRPRLGTGFDLPVVYAGNASLRPQIETVLGGKVALTCVDNVRPVLEIEQLGPARDAIHELFLEHVMKQAPGYGRLMTWTDIPIVPTPGAMGVMMQALAQTRGANVMGVDIGGATTDVFSVFDGAFNRTVAANLGMSYSVSNILAEAGMAAIAQWLPFAIDEAVLRDRIGNKMIRPTTVPQTLEDLIVEQALAREALRLALVQHKAFAVALTGGQAVAGLAGAFADAAPASLVDMMKLDILVGSGGVLSHAPRRAQAMLMLMDAFAVEGITELAVDSIFMMPHLGVLAEINAEAATEVFERDCLIPLGTVIAPVFDGARAWRSPVATVNVQCEGQADLALALHSGELRRVPLATGQACMVRITPAHGVDVGAGRGKAVERRVRGGEVGLVLDGRGRPLHVPTGPAARAGLLTSWLAALDVY